MYRIAVFAILAATVPFVALGQVYPLGYSAYNDQSYQYSQSGSNGYYRFPPSYLASCYLLNRNLGMGDRGQDVGVLQQELQSQGYFIGDPYGLFGNGTAYAVARFQEYYANEILAPTGLSLGTGYVGYATRIKLNAMFGCGLSPMISPGGYPYYDYTAQGQSQNMGVYQSNQAYSSYPPVQDP